MKMRQLDLTARLFAHLKGTYKRMRQRFVLFMMIISLLGGLFIGGIHAQEATSTPQPAAVTPLPDIATTEEATATLASDVGTTLEATATVASNVGRPSADTDTTVGLPQAFTAYACTFNRETNQAQIQTVFMGANGRPVERGDFRNIAVVQTGDNTTLPSRDIEITTLDQRPPMQLVLVLDITETVPLQEIKQTLIDNLIPALLPEDQVALITFGAGVSDPSPFYTDKNRLINEYVLDLETESGNNRIYNSVLAAVDTLENFQRSERRTILIITDSGRRVDEQASIDEIVARSQNSGIQFYAIGFYSRDRPDVDILRQMAYDTNGFAWFYEDEENSRGSIQSNVAAFLGDFATAVNSELRVDIAAPLPSSAVSDLAQYRLSVVQSGTEAYETTINCPIEQLNHSIAFTGENFEYVTSDPVPIEVIIETDLSPDAVRVRFFVDNEPIQTDESTHFDFITSRMTPGQHEVRAVLLDENDNQLATTINSINIYAQQTFDVVFTSGSIERLDEAIELDVTTGSDIQNVQINLYTPGNETPLTLANRSISNGLTDVLLPNLQSSIVNFAPSTQTGDRVQIRIEAPGATPSDPPLANPYVIDLPYTAPFVAVTAAEQPAPLWSRILRFIRVRPLLLRGLISFCLLLVNILLLRVVRRSQIRKMIARPDKLELSPQLMTITVRADGAMQTFPLTKKTLLVGRGDKNDIVLGTDDRISRDHGVVMWRKNAWWYTNRKSDVFAVVEGRRVRGLKAVELLSPTTIEFPGAVMIFHFGSQQQVETLFNTDLGEI